MNQHKPEEYEYIQAWGRFMRSFPAYRWQQQRLAAEEGAPLNAIYKDADGRWQTFDDIISEDTKTAIQADVDYYRKLRTQGRRK